MKSKYRPLTLLEVMISIVLAGILLGFLFEFFRQTLVTKNKIKALEERMLHWELLRIRLNQLFNKFCGEDGAFIRTVVSGEVAGTALLVCVDNAIDPDPVFTGPIYGMLYRSRENQLSLTISSVQHKESRVDLLLEGVKGLTFAFFDGTTWKSVWPKEEKGFPWMIKVSVDLGQEKKEFVFFLDRLHPKIEYS